MIKNIDSTDRKILGVLQTDATQSLEKIADTLSLSVNNIWRRVKRLEKDGVIQRRVALVDPAAVGLNVTVFVAVKTGDHSADWLDRFAGAASKIPEVVELYRMAGDVDYLIKLLVRDVGDYDRVYRKLIDAAPMRDVSASFAMEAIKVETAVPL